MRTGVWLFPDAPSAALLDAGAAAEAGGLDELWLGDEGPARDPFAVLAALAVRTERLLLGLGVTNPYLRHPAVTAASMATVHELSGGRGILGLGPGGHLALGPVGLAPRDHLTACRHAMQLIRGVLDGRSVDGYTPPRHAMSAPDLPVFVGARGERFNRWASEAADGVFLAGIAPSLLPTVIAWAQSSRPVALSLYVSTLLDDRELEPTRPRMIHAFSNGPDELLARAGVDRREAQDAAAALSAGDEAPAARIMTDDRLDLVLARGPVRLREVLGALARAHAPVSVGVALLGADPVDQVERAAAALRPLHEELS